MRPLLAEVLHDLSLDDEAIRLLDVLDNEHNQTMNPQQHLWSPFLRVTCNDSKGPGELEALKPLVGDFEAMGDGEDEE